MEVAVGLILLVGVVMMVVFVLGLVAWSRRNRADSAPPPIPAPPVPDRRGSGRSRSDREVRTGARHLTTEPESDEALTLKQRLTEAVADLADEVEDRPERPLSSEEMIAEAKRRIRPG